MKLSLAMATVGVSALLLAPRPALAHCDTLDGPVVKDARVALESKDVTPVLKWVRPDKEGEDPGIAASDTALETGSVGPLVKQLTAEVDRGLRHRFTEVAEARRHAAESVEKGRLYVAACVEFVHFAERLQLAATSAASHAGPTEREGPAEHAH